jgi:hypothetical protein
VIAAEVAEYEAVFARSLAAGAHFQDALKAAYRSALTSAAMLMRQAKGRGELAARLSYFLWAGPPDEQLLALDESGALKSDPKVRSEQVGRLLKDKKAQRFIEDFTGQWLRLRDINATQPDKELYPEFTPLLQDAMLAETRAFFTDLLQRDLSVTHLVKADFAWLNEPLARLYGVAGVAGHDFQKVKLPADSWRGGLLTQASILKLTANGTTTSPVTRGAFVLERILGITPTPPPADAGVIEPDTRGTTTIREQLLKHQRNETCAGCHAKMDPYGFALESFDVVGEQRAQYRVRGGSGQAEQRKKVHGKTINYHYEQAVDASGQLPDGKTFQNLGELRDHLASQPRVLARAFLGHLVLYATGAEISFADRRELEKILDRTEAARFPLRTLLTEAVLSPLFTEE